MSALTCQSTTNTTSAAMMPVPTASTFKVTIPQRRALTSWSCQSQSTPILLADLAAMLASVAVQPCLPKLWRDKLWREGTVASRMYQGSCHKHSIHSKIEGTLAQPAESDNSNHSRESGYLLAKL